MIQKNETKKMPPPTQIETLIDLRKFERQSGTRTQKEMEADLANCLEEMNYYRNRDVVNDLKGGLDDFF